MGLPRLSCALQTVELYRPSAKLEDDIIASYTPGEIVMHCAACGTVRVGKDDLGGRVLIRTGPPGALFREALCLSSFRHVRVLALLDVDGDNIAELSATVTECPTRYNLVSALAGGSRLLPSDIVTMLKTLASPVDALHAQGFQHGCLNPSAATCGRLGWQLGNFGHAQRLGKRYVRPSNRGAANFVAPWQRGHGSVACISGDLWSLTMLTYCLAEGKNPLSGGPMTPQFERNSWYCWAFSGAFATARDLADSFEAWTMGRRSG